MKPNVAIFGEALFDFIAQEHNRFESVIGGSPFNVARAFARQGAHCAYLSPISSDAMGSQIRDVLTEEGITFSQDTLSPLPTSLALVYKDSNGQPDYCLYRSGIADLDITAEQLINRFPAQLDLFHTGSLMLVPAMEEILVASLSHIKTTGTKISIDVNVRKGVEQDQQSYVRTIRRCMALADIVKISDEDLRLMGLNGEPEVHAQEILSQMQNGMVVLTYGEHGSTLLTGNQRLHQAVVKPRQFIDAVGAGDTFFASLLGQLLANDALEPNAPAHTLQHALHVASAAASLNIEKKGCQPPNTAELNERLAQLS